MPLLRKILVQEFYPDRESETLTISIPAAWPKLLIFRYLVKTYGRCIGRSSLGWEFSRAIVKIEGAVETHNWRLL